jgi:hypothetical protein
MDPAGTHLLQGRAAGLLASTCRIATQILLAGVQSTRLSVSPGMRTLRIPVYALAGGAAAWAAQCAKRSSGGAGVSSRLPCWHAGNMLCSIHASQNNHLLPSCAAHHTGAYSFCCHSASAGSCVIRCLEAHAGMHVCMYTRQLTTGILYIARSTLLAAHATCPAAEQLLV